MIRGGCGVAALLMMLLWCWPEAAAQEVTEPSLKAAFIDNFAKFTDWPEDVLSAGAPFTACVLGDVTVGDALRKTMDGRKLEGLLVRVAVVTPGGSVRACHLLYLSDLATVPLADVVASVNGLPMLTIGDADDFARVGGIAHMFVEDGKMRFALNLQRARRSRLRLSSQLLALATRIYDASNPVSR